MAAKKKVSNGKEKAIREACSEIEARIKKAEKPKKEARVKKTAVVTPEGVDWGVRVREGNRIASAGRGDRVAEELAKCTDVDSLVAFASEFIPEKDVQGYLDRAPNFGQFRMVIGNRIRGAISRAERERLKESKAVKA